MLNLKKFTQYEISKQEKISFSLVNRVVNWFLSRGYVAKRTRYYEVISPTAIFNLFPIYRKLKPYEVLDIDIQEEQLYNILGKNAKFCLTTALSRYDNFFRDPAIHIYLDDSQILSNLKKFPKGYSHIEVYKEDLNKNDFIENKGVLITSKTRTIIDLFCAKKAYAAERMIKKEWV
jgi:hypothetical protein